jgi:hypothetical protein
MLSIIGKGAKAKGSCHHVQHEIVSEMSLEGGPAVPRIDMATMTLTAAGQTAAAAILWRSVVATDVEHNW